MGGGGKGVIQSGGGGGHSAAGGGGGGIMQILKEEGTVFQTERVEIRNHAGKERVGMVEVREKVPGKKLGSHKRQVRRRIPLIMEKRILMSWDRGSHGLERGNHTATL
jgi:hypothetical protein